jgi:hypothetical protein
MRVHAILIGAALLGTAAAAAETDSNPPGRTAARSHCPSVSSYQAEKPHIHQGQPLKPRKLAELPPGKAYMAVYREIGGCESPLTMADYRRSQR